MSNSKSTLYQSTNSSTSTLRPRNARLISYLEEDGNSSTDPTIAATTASSTSTPVFRSSRDVSPFAEGTRTTLAGTSRLNAPASRGAIKDNNDRRASSTIWDSWSSISGIASTFLGSDGSRSNPVSRSNSSKASPATKRDRGVYSTKTAKAWGPSDSSLQGSSIEDRRSILQAKKREAILAAGNTEQIDSLGRYKRKGSNSGFTSVPENVGKDDVLVYRHNVRPDDTMAGVVIKYSCQPEIFRKVNRFWPNDNIQRRAHVLLPVDACAIRGKKVDEPNPFDLLEPELDKLKRESFEGTVSENGPHNEISDHHAFVSPVLMSPQRQKSDEENYEHNHWVLLPTFPQPTEILRLSRRSLGYFPPARRKSNTTPFADSGTSTPKSSFDTLRHPPTHAAQQAHLLQQQSNASSDASFPRMPPLPPYLSPSSRPRSSSTASAPSTASTAFVNVLRGPGGVGTLRGLRTEIARPGPAEDPLNKKFAAYIPDLLPSSDDDNKFLSPDHHRRTASSSLRMTPRASTESARSTRSNSSTVPAAIDGWLKRMTSVGTSGNGSRSPMRKKLEAGRHDSNQLQLLGGNGNTGVDLIELDDTLSCLHGNDAEDNDLTPTATPIIPESTQKNTPAFGKSDEELMNERFPVRGRVRRAYEAD